VREHTRAQTRVGQLTSQAPGQPRARARGQHGRGLRARARALLPRGHIVVQAEEHPRKQSY